ncbi:MAG: hypothetical protein EBT03_07240 [Betaproteobacteria bacterium]|nr:hypothetical protein [Betaproteobacteria bacterium]NCA17586.1 hypothetical protein [Betaproteobacteria bacterium]
MKKIGFDLDDLTNSALKRMVRQLLTASDSEEKSILEKLMGKAKGKEKPPKNDLADLVEEKRGKYNAPMVEDDDLPPKDSEDSEMED